MFLFLPCLVCVRACYKAMGIETFKRNFQNDCGLPSQPQPWPHPLTHYANTGVCVVLPAGGRDVQLLLGLSYFKHWHFIAVSRRQVISVPPPRAGEGELY